MKTPQALLASATLLLIGCQKAPPVADATPAPAPVATPAPTLPAPVIVAAPAPATPEPDPLAQEGVFFLTERVSVEHDGGLVGFKPGTQVKKTGPDEYTANEGKPDAVKLKLGTHQLTNNLRIAKALTAADAAGQLAIARQFAEAQRLAAARRAIAPATPDPARPRGTPPPPPPASKNPLNKGAFGQKQAF